MHIPTEETLDFVKEVSSRHFPDKTTSFLEDSFSIAHDLFEGRYPGYQASDTAYHDFKHTCEAAVAVVRILDGHLKSEGHLPLSHRDLELTIIATLLHDSGFIKKEDDHSGTGAKYTLTHVRRSGDFAAACLASLGVRQEEIHLVRAAIDCTGVHVQAHELPFRNECERFLGNSLGTGDMLGQMAAPDYPERLDDLYREFSEAAQAPGGAGTWIAGYSNAADLKRKTRHFWEDYVKKEMLNRQWCGVHKNLIHHFQDGRNHYFEEIEANLIRIERELASG